MPSQLIFTSAPRGLTPGQSGYCTVARSADLREGLIPVLEKLSYYTPAQSNPVVCAYRIVEIRGARFHVLTRICDAGLDFTKRKKFLAHHLVFTAEELPAVSPALIFLRWDGWKTRWEGEPQMLEAPPAKFDLQPANAWEQLTGSAANAPALLESEWVTGDEDERRSFLAALDETLRGEKNPWGVTFTNRFQKGDEAGDFRIKAIWPEDGPVDKSEQRLRLLRFAGKRDPIATKEKAVEKPKKADATAAPAPRRSLWPIWAGAAAVIVIGAIVVSRGKREKVAPVSEEVSQAAAAAPAINVDALLAKFAPGGKLVVSNQPVRLSKDLVVVNGKTQSATLPEELETRIRQLSLPEGATLALRPQKDFVGPIAEAFGLMSSLVFDLGAIRTQIDRVLAEEEKSVRERETELAELTAKEKALVTSPQNADETKWTERLKVLKMAVPEDLKELAALKKKAATAPKDVRQVGNFSLFLCQKKGNTEIVRFDEEPELVRVASP